MKPIREVFRHPQTEVVHSPEGHLIEKGQREPDVLSRKQRLTQIDVDDDDDDDDDDNEWHDSGENPPLGPLLGLPMRSSTRSLSLSRATLRDF